jgi:alpha-2-macroglobulin
VEALPYLLEFPHGCTEQTLNRFLPAAVAQKTLHQLGVDLQSIAAKRPARLARDANPVFDEERMVEITKAGLEQLTSMQNADGGWGWFSGKGESSYAHTTAVVVHGLQAAQAAGLTLVPGMLDRGFAWLTKAEQKELAELKLWETTKGTKEVKGKRQPDDLDAFVHLVLSEGTRPDKAMRQRLYENRTTLSVYGKTCLGLALALQKQTKERDMLLQNIEQYLQQDPENQTAHLDLQNANSWWYWYGNSIEAQALYLRLLVLVDPTSDKASGLAKYLVNNRKNSTWWTSTRDTAYAIEALAAYTEATQEDKPDVNVRILLDGKELKNVRITQDNLIGVDHSITLTGDDLTSGEHRLEVIKTGNTPLYFNAYVSNFTKEEKITPAGLEVKVERHFYKLTSQSEATQLVRGAHGQTIDQKVSKMQRMPLKTGDELASGDLIEVELVVHSKNRYEYLLFEDPKAAGCEAVEVQSGYSTSGLPAYREFRNDKVCSYVQWLPEGTSTLSYRLRAEIPGKFSALPAQATAMYAPDIRGNSADMLFHIRERQ